MAAPAFAQAKDSVQRGPAPTWITPSDMLPVPDKPGGAIFMRRQDLVVHLSDKGQEQYLGYRVKILHANALALGNISIVWDPAAGAPTVHEIQVYRDGQPIDVLQGSSFEVLRREDQLEASRLDGRLTAVLRVPDLRVGDELSVAMTTLSRDPTMGGHETGLLLLAPSPASGRYHLGLNWDQGREPAVKMTPDISPVAQRGNRTIDFRFDNPAILSPPKDAPPRYQWQRAIQYSDFTDWKSFSRHFAGLYVKAAALAPDSSIRKEVSRIATANARPLDRAGAALRLVQQDVRYIYVGLNGGNLSPASAEETWQRRYGDCKGKTALLLALLHELGIEAEPVLINSGGNDDGLDQRLPIAQLFDHVLVRASIDGVTYWLDGTLPPVAPPSIEPVFPFTWALPLSTPGAELVALKWQPAQTPVEVNLYEIDARAGFDKPAHITSTAIVRGVKGLQQQIQLSSASPEQLLTAFRQQMIGDTWQAIDEVQWRYDQKANASILTISGTGTVDWDDDGDGAKSLALPGGGFSPPDKRIRAADQNQDVPFFNSPDYQCYVTTVRLPAGTQPRQWSSKPGFDVTLFGRHYHRAFELRDNSIRMVRGSRIEQREIAASVARSDNARIATFDNSMGWIFYNPAARNETFGGAEKVPATYDFDWTANDVSCVAK